MGFDQSAKMHQYSKTTHENMEKGLVLQAGFVAAIVEGVYISGCVNLKTRLINAARISCTGWTKNCKHHKKFFSHQFLSELPVLDLELLSSESSWHGISWRVQTLEELEVYSSIQEG